MKKHIIIKKILVVGKGQTIDFKIELPKNTKKITGILVNNDVKRVDFPANSPYIPVLSAVEDVLSNILVSLIGIQNNSKSKIDRIKGASNYSKSLSYVAGTTPIDTYPSQIVHNGTTEFGNETITEVFQYTNAPTNMTYIGSFYF